MKTIILLVAMALALASCAPKAKTEYVIVNGSRYIEVHSQNTSISYTLPDVWEVSEAEKTPYGAYVKFDTPTRIRKGALLVKISNAVSQDFFTKCMASKAEFEFCAQRSNSGMITRFRDVSLESENHFAAYEFDIRFNDIPGTYYGKSVVFERGGSLIEATFFDSFPPSKKLVKDLDWLVESARSVD